MSARGLSLALASTALTSAAQLAMHFSVTRLPPGLDPLRHWAALQAGAELHAVLALGILGYAASMACWLAALGHIALGRAYAILALGYPLVYLASALLPGFQGSLSPGKTLGVLLIVGGVVLIHLRPEAATGALPMKE